MATKSTPANGSWFNHETDPSKHAELSTAFTALERQKHSSGWRRNVLVLIGAVVFVAALKLLASM